MKSPKKSYNFAEDTQHHYSRYLQIIEYHITLKLYWLNFRIIQNVSNQITAIPTAWRVASNFLRTKRGSTNNNTAVQQDSQIAAACSWSNFSRAVVSSRPSPRRYKFHPAGVYAHRLAFATRKKSSSAGIFHSVVRFRRQFGVEFGALKLRAFFFCLLFPGRTHITATTDDQLASWSSQVVIRLRGYVMG